MDPLDFQWIDYVATPIFLIEVGEDEEPRFVSNNHTHFLMSGLRTEDLVGQTALDLFPSRIANNVYQRHCQVMRTGEPLKYDLMFNFPSGTRMAHTTLEPVKGADGKVVFIVGTMIESSKDEASRTAEIEAQARQMETMREMEQFIAMAAHDLRAPLRQVGSIGDMLREDATDLKDDQLELLDMLKDVSERASQVITEVLSYAQSVSIETELSEIDFFLLCNDLVAFLDPAGMHRFTISKIRFNGDPLALKLVLRNLIENAIKHAGAGSVDVCLCAEAIAGDRIRFTVKDNGSGFDDPSIAFLDGGKFRHETGFGLLGVRSIVRSRGGDIHASHPTSGTGALIEFTLPGQMIADERIAG